jgi:hypothetical protein
MPPLPPIVRLLHQLVFDILELNNKQWGNVKNIIVVTGFMHINELVSHIQNFCHWKNDVLHDLPPTEHHNLFCLYHF